MNLMNKIIDHFDKFQIDNQDRLWILISRFFLHLQTPVWQATPVNICLQHLNWKNRINSKMVHFFYILPPFN